MKQVFLFYVQNHHLSSKVLHCTAYRFAKQACRGGSKSIECQSSDKFTRLYQNQFLPGAKCQFINIFQQFLDGLRIQKERNSRGRNMLEVQSLKVIAHHICMQAIK